MRCLGAQGSRIVSATEAAGIGLRERGRGGGLALFSNSTLSLMPRKSPG